MKRLNTNSRATSEAIRDREPFNTHGALKGRAVDGLTSRDAGRLDGRDAAEFLKDKATIDYVVTSYATPIAWHTPAGWYVVAQKFSPTTSRHQGNLYLIREDKR